MSNLFEASVIRTFHQKPLLIAFLVNFLFYGLYGAALLFDGQMYSHFAVPANLGTTDLAGAIRLVQVIRSSNSLFLETNFVSYPSGQEVFSIYEFSQLIPTLVIIAISKVFFFASPKICVLIVQFIFSVFSTFCLVLLLRRVFPRVSMIYFFLSLVFLSNFVFDLSSIHINGLLWGYPFLLINEFYRRIGDEEYSFAKAATLFTASFLIDIYLVYMNLFIICAFFCFSFSRKKKVFYKRKTRYYETSFSRYRFVWLICLFSFLGLMVQQSGIQDFFESLYGSIASPAASLGFQPFKLNGLNIFIFVTFLLVVVYRSRISTKDYFLIWIAGIFFMFSVNTFNLPSVSQNVSPTYLFRYALPGFDHNQRIIPVAVLCLGVLYLKIFLSIGFIKYKPLLFRKALMICFIMFAGIRLIFMSFTSHVGVHSERYEVFRNQIPSESGFIALPLAIEGRTWIQQAYLNRPMVNGIRNEILDQEIGEVAQLGPSAFKKFMSSKNVEFLVKPCEYDLNGDPTISSWKSESEFKKNFILTSEIIDEGYELGKIQMCLYRASNFNS
jgi:hypothetical protein